MAVFFSECSTLAVGCHLYSDPEKTIPVPDQFYSNSFNCYEISGGTGEIVVISACPPACDLVFENITSTDPTTIGGSDGTITITFSSSNSPFSYSLNDIDQGVAVSPLVITGLSSSVEYKVIVTDSNECSAQATITLGQSATVFEADWIMVTYEFDDGNDLDTRTRIALPNVGQDTQPEYLGWSCLGSFLPSEPYSADPNRNPNNYVIMWGGDNTGTGFESVLVNINKFKTDVPLATEFFLDLRAFWYSTVGVNPVVAAVTLWKGGTPVHNGCVSGVTPFCWTNPTATLTGTIDSVPKLITLNTSNQDTAGQRVATLSYNLNTFIAVINNNDTSTPVVPSIPPAP